MLITFPKHNYRAAVKAFSGNQLFTCHRPTCVWFRNPTDLTCMPNKYLLFVSLDATYIFCHNVPVVILFKQNNMHTYIHMHT